MSYIKFSKKVGGALLLLLASCTDLTTNEVDSTVVEDTGGGGPAGNPSELLTTAYRDLGAFTDQANIYALMEHGSDEMIPPTRGVDWGDNGVWRTLHQHTWDPTHSWILNTWNQLNQRVYRATQLLASNPNPTQAAEAKFIRAFNMFWVMDFYGKVPFRGATEGVDVNPAVKTRTEAFDFIVADLEAVLAEPTIPNGNPADNSDNDKVTKAAAHALLARLYLNKAVYSSTAPEGPYTFAPGDMDKVIQHADAVIALGYTLEPNYFDNFSTDGDSELIFTVDTGAGTPQNRWFMTLHYDQNPSGWNGFTTLADFYGTFNDANDQRKGAPSPASVGANFHGITRGFLVGQQYKDNGTKLVDSRSQKDLVFTPDITLSGAATEKGIRVIKYHPVNAGEYILLRFADVYLMKAEALLRKGGGDAAALAIVNDLRAVRGATPLGSLTLGAMLEERGRELYWEGVRRNDQVRFGTWSAAWTEKSNVETFRVLYPIPQQAMDSNPNLTQNAGY